MKSIRFLLFLVIILLTGFLISSPVIGSAKWWDKFGEPKYGGVIRARVNNTSDLAFDPYSHPWKEGYGLFYFDCLFSNDWIVDRSIWPFITGYTPEKYYAGNVAERWENLDGKTLIVQLRHGVHFQDKEPVNGRELTADDVVYHYDRICGTGSGFTKPAPFHNNFTNLIEDITAIDKYTVEFKFKNASVVNTAILMGGGHAHYLEAPEISQQYGNLNDWKHAVGTGPWIVTDFIDGSSLRHARNQNYWGKDERHPENSIPYADELIIVCIPDRTAAIAALRTGKIDILPRVDWQSAENVAKSNPDLLQSKIPASGNSVVFNLNESPFGDINVRKALQMAIDRPPIAKSLFGGIVDGIPCGEIHPALKGYAYSYDQWPAELREEYSYNPEKAKKLLTEAGYPNGFDTSIAVPTTADLALMQVIKDQFQDIGVKMEIQTMDIAIYIKTILGHKHKLALSGQECGNTGFPWISLMQKSPFFINPGTVDDPVYNEMLLKITSSVDQNEIAQLCRQAKAYMLSHHWQVQMFPIYTFNIWRPEIRGYSGELLETQDYFSRWWKE